MEVTQSLLKTALPLLITLITSTQAMSKPRSEQSLLPRPNSKTAITDVTLETSSSQFRIRRFHNPLFQGYFGKGWCSDIDLKLELLSERTIALKACRVLDPVLFVFPQASLEVTIGMLNEVTAATTTALSLKKIGAIWILKFEGVAIAQFNLQGRPLAIRSVHDGKSPSSEWLHFRYSEKGRLTELAFLPLESPGDTGQRFMANVQTMNAKIVLKDDGEVIQEIRTPVIDLQYIYQGNHLTQIQDGKTLRSPD